MTAQTLSLFGYAVVNAQQRVVSKAAGGYAVQRVSGNLQTRAVFGYAVRQIARQTATRSLYAYAITSVDASHGAQTRLLAGYIVRHVQYRPPYPTTMSLGSYAAVRVGQQATIYSKSIYGWAVVKPERRTYSSSVAGYAVSRLGSSTHLRSKALFGYNIISPASSGGKHVRTKASGGYVISLVERKPTLAYGGFAFTITLSNALQGGDAIDILFGGLKSAHKDVKIRIYQDKAELYAGVEKLQTWVFGLSKPSGPWHVLAANDIISIAREDEIGFLYVPYADYKHSDICLTISKPVNISGQVTLHEFPDLFGATYIETDNTISAGLANIFKDRPFIIGQSADLKTLEIFSRRHTSPDTAALNDAFTIMLQPGKALPSRGMVMGGDIITFHTGGEAFGTAVVRVAADALLGVYGRTALQRTHSARWSARTTTIVRPGMKATAYFPHQGHSRTIDLRDMVVIQRDLRVSASDLSCTFVAIKEVQ